MQLKLPYMGGLGPEGDFPFLTYSCLEVCLTSVVWTGDNFENNFIMKH